MGYNRLATGKSCLTQVRLVCHQGVGLKPVKSELALPIVFHDLQVPQCISSLKARRQLQRKNRKSSRKGVSSFLFVSVPLLSSYWV